MIRYKHNLLMMPLSDIIGGGGTESTTVTVPQPLTNLPKYASEDALTVDLAMRLYVNSTFDGPNGKVPSQAAMDSIVRAREFMRVAHDMITGLIDTRVPDEQ